MGNSSSERRQATSKSATEIEPGGSDDDSDFISPIRLQESQGVLFQEIVRRHYLDFRSPVSYNRFVELQKRCVMPLFFYLLIKRSRRTGISFIDATSLKVFHNLRIPAHRVFCGSPHATNALLAGY